MPGPTTTSGYSAPRTLSVPSPNRCDKMTTPVRPRTPDAGTQTDPVTERYAIEPEADTRTGTERRHATWRVTDAGPPDPESDPEPASDSASESRRRRAEMAAAIALAKAVRDARVSAGLSEADLATRAGLDEDAVVRIEESGTVPTPAVLNRLARALDGDVALTWTGKGVTATFTPHPT